LPEEICQHVVTLQHLELYAEKVKDVSKLTSDVAQYVAYNMPIAFFDDDLLLGSNHIVVLYSSLATSGNKKLSEFWQIEGLLLTSLSLQ